MERHYYNAQGNLAADQYAAATKAERLILGRRKDIEKHKDKGHVLDVDDKKYSWTVNEAFLDAGVDRGSKFYFVSDPRKAKESCVA